jgi:hypothetical protein
MSKLRIEAGYGPGVITDPTDEYLNEMENMRDKPWYNPKNPMALSYAKAKQALTEFIDLLQDDYAEMKGESYYGAEFESILEQVLPAYDAIKAVDQEIQNLGADYDVGE